MPMPASPLQMEHENQLKTLRRCRHNGLEADMRQQQIGKAKRKHERAQCGNSRIYTATLYGMCVCVYASVRVRVCVQLTDSAISQIDGIPLTVSA